MEISFAPVTTVADFKTDVTRTNKRTQASTFSAVEQLKQETQAGECRMETRLFINAGIPVANSVDETSVMRKCENGEIARFAGSAALRYTPTTIRAGRRKSSPSAQTNIFQSFRTQNFQLRIDIPPSTRSDFSW